MDLSAILCIHSAKLQKNLSRLDYLTKEKITGYDLDEESLLYSVSLIHMTTNELGSEILYSRKHTSTLLL